MLYLPEKHTRSSQTWGRQLDVTLAVFFMVRALDSFGFAFVDVLAAATASVVVATAADEPASSLSPLVSDLSRASSSSLTRFNLSSPQAFFKNSWPA